VLSRLSQVWYPIFGVVKAMGIAFLLVWGKITERWVEMGLPR
jgi:hypothetical protein